MNFKELIILSAKQFSMAEFKFLVFFSKVISGFVFIFLFGFEEVEFN